MLTSPKAGNIGVIFDEHLSMVPQVTVMCKSAFCHLRKISLIRKHLTFDAAQLLVHALITSKLDYCNSLLYDLPKHMTKQLQRVQNAAALIVSLSPKFCHITPVLMSLHWLPIDLLQDYPWPSTCLHRGPPWQLHSVILDMQRKIYSPCLDST